MSRELGRGLDTTFNSTILTPHIFQVNITSVIQLIMIVLLIPLVIKIIMAQENQDFTFLVEGENIEFSQSTKTDRITLILAIDLDSVSGRKAFKAIDVLLTSWANYPAFNQTPEIGLTYLSLTEKAVDDLLKAAALLDRIVLFRDPNSPRNTTYSCSYKHEIISLSELESQVYNLQSNFKRLDPSWTSTEILEDLSKDTALRHFATLLTETTENWEESFNIMLSTLDTLASNKIPPEVQGHYQDAPCIGNYFEEALTVMDCYEADLGYYCDLEVTVPLSFISKVHMLPVHYNDIRIRGSTKEQYFIKEAGSKVVQLIECNHYGFNKENIPICEISDIEDDCKQALVSDDINSIIKQCNFTQHQPDLAVRTATGGLLVQGTDVTTLVQNDTGYVTISDTTPILVHSPANIKIQQGKESFTFASIFNQVSTKVSSSKLTKDLISTLKVKFYWQSFLEDFDSEDLLQYLVLILQVILYPIALSGVALGIRAKRKVISNFIKGSKKHGKHTYKSNKIALKRFK